MGRSCLDQESGANRKGSQSQGEDEEWMVRREKVFGVKEIRERSKNPRMTLAPGRFRIQGEMNKPRGGDKLRYLEGGQHSVGLLRGGKFGIEGTNK